MNPEQTPAEVREIPAEVREIADDMHAAVAKHPNISAELVVAIARIQWSVNSKYVSDAEFRAEGRAIVAALALVHREVAERQDRLIAEVRAERDAAATRPRIDTEAAARDAFARGHLEDDDNERGVYVADRCVACGHEAEHLFASGCVARRGGQMGIALCGCKYVAGGA